METTKKTCQTEEKGESRLAGLLKLLLKFLIAAGIIAYLVYSSRERASSWGEHLQNLRWGWLIPAAIGYAFHIFVNAWRWHLLLKVRGIPCSLFNACSLTMQSFFFSLVMPGGAIGGDVVRAGFLARALPKGSVFEGVFTILMDRFTGMIAIFSLALLMLPCCWWCIGSVTGLAATFNWILLAGSCAGLIAAVIVFQHKKLERFAWYRWLHKTADRFSGGLFSKVSDSIDSYCDCKKEIVICVAAGIIGVNLTLALVMYCVCLVVVPAGTCVPFTAALGAITLGNIAGLIPLTPSGVGMRDFIVMAILGAAAFPGDPLVPTILMTLYIFGFNLLGGLFFVFSDHPKSKEKAA